jgi:molybdenum cofactor cytidylyltransferase
LNRMHYTVEQCVIVLLAAGMSSRLGRPKQLLMYKNKSLLQHAADAALQTSLRPVVIVVGANSDAMKKQMEGLKVEIAENEAWPEGIASSLRYGLATVQKMKPGADGIIFLVCDQPYVNKSLLDSLLMAQHETGLPIVASSYEGRLGTPALFHKSLFPELLELTGDVGARKLIVQHANDVATVLFPKGHIDIDTAAEYEALKQNELD